MVAHIDERLEGGERGCADPVIVAVDRLGRIERERAARRVTTHTPLINPYYSDVSA